MPRERLIASMRAAGASIYDIAKEAGVSPQSIHKRIQRMPAGALYAQEEFEAPLELEIAICEEKLAGNSVKRIADKHSLSPEQVTYVLRSVAQRTVKEEDPFVKKLKDAGFDEAKAIEELGMTQKALRKALKQPERMPKKVRTYLENMRVPDLPQRKKKNVKNGRVLYPLIRNKMNEQGLSISSMAQDLCMPYQSLYTMLTRTPKDGVEWIGQSRKMVAAYLGLAVDEAFTQEEEKKDKTE